MNSEQQQQQEQRRHRRHRKVSFALRAQALVVPSLEAYSERQKGLMWQTPSEKKADQAELVKTVRAARQGMLQQPGSKSVAGLCGRGLEHLCCTTSMRLMVQRRELLLDAVLDNQEEQWQQGTFHADPEIIRKIAIAHTKVDTERAIRLAAEDEAFVRGLRKFDEAKPKPSI